jgi:flagellar motor switch protein FliN/FliY
MTSDMLSQDEIDALLRQGNSDQEEEEQSEQDVISEIERDTLGEIGNISFGSASTALSTLLNHKVDITTPKTSLIHTEQLRDEFPVPHVAIHVNYTYGFQGINMLVIKTDDAKIIADLMLGGDGTAPSEEMSEMQISAVQEAMNQMMGSAATSMSTIFSKRIDISPPGVDIFDPNAGESASTRFHDELLVKVSFNLKIGTLVDSNIMQLIPVSFAKEMVHHLLNPEEHQQNEMLNQTGGDTSVSNEEKQYEQVQPQSQSQQVSQPVYSQQEHVSQQSNVNQRATNVQPVQFSSFDQPTMPNVDAQNLNLLLDIPLQVTVELGRTKRLIKDILELSPGSILELDKLAGEPVDILVNNKLIAKGEVVVIEENFGVRVTDILSQVDRLQKLQ